MDIFLAIAALVILFVLPVVIALALFGPAEWGQE